GSLNRATAGWGRGLLQLAMRPSQARSAAVHSRWEGVGLLVDAVAGHPGRDGASRTLRGAVGDLDGVLPEALNLSDGGDESRLRRVHRVAVVIEQHCLLGAVVLAGDVDPGKRRAGVIEVGLQRVVEAA